MVGRCYLSAALTTALHQRSLQCPFSLRETLLWLVDESEGGLITNYTSNSSPELINLKDTILIAEKVVTEA